MDKNKIEKIENKLDRLDIHKGKIHEEFVKQKHNENEMFHLFQDKEQFFNNLFQQWKQGEMRFHIDQVYADIKSAEKSIIHEFNVQKEQLRKERYELDMKEDELRTELMRLAENGNE